MYKKITKEDLTKIKFGDVLYKYPMSGNEQSEFKEADLGQSHELIVADIDANSHVSFVNNMKLDRLANVLKVGSDSKRPIATLLNGFWWRWVDETWKRSSRRFDSKY